MTDKEFEENKRITLTQFKKELVKYKNRLIQMEEEKHDMYYKIKKIRDTIFDFDIHDAEVEKLDYECKFLMEDISGFSHDL